MPVLKYKGSDGQVHELQIAEDSVISIGAGSGINVDNTDPRSPILSVNDTDYLHKSGTETATGLKTFSDVKLSPNAAPTYEAGKLAYDSARDALTWFNSDPNVGLQVGEEHRIKVMNNTGADIANGIPVYVTGADATSNLPTIAMSRSNVIASSAILGLTTEAIANGGSGYVTIDGIVMNVNTSAFTLGQTLYVSSATAGLLVNTSATSSTNNVVRAGFVVKVGTTDGMILSSPVTLPLYSGQAATTDLGVVLSNAGIRIAGTAYNISTSGAAALSGTLTATGSQVRSNTTSTASVTMAATTFVQRMNVATANNCTLPTATNGKIITIKNIGAGTTSLIGTVDGSTSQTLLTNKSYVLHGNGTSWDIIAGY